MKQRWRTSISFRLMAVSIIAFCVIFGAMGLVVVRTRRSLQEKAEESVEFIAREISGNLDNVMLNVQIMSETYADNQRLTAYLDQVFDEESQLAKAYKATTINSQVFDGLTRFREMNHISAVYNTVSGELFNFLDPNVTHKGAIEALLTLDVGSSDKLARYYSYPLQDNFLRSEQYGDPRLDSVLLISRRVFSIYHSGYPYVHIFALPENKLYEGYAQLASQAQGEVYIINKEGALFSSSDINAVIAREAPPLLVAAVLERGQDTFEILLDGEKKLVSVYESDFNSSQTPDERWVTVFVAPKSNATQDVQSLYLMFFIALFACVLVSFLLLYFLYRRFMNPISMLNNAMREVDEGNLNAYLPDDKRNDEASAMLRRYNRMLRSINHNIDERMALEEEKNDLDMQVLTAQINPHFLYNTLETIVWKAEESSRPDIAALANSLGDLYRLSIAYDSVLVPLSHEIDHILSYVDIQRARYQEDFSFDLRFDANACGDFLVPKIILQPLVENVFLHAMSKTTQKVSCRVTVRCKADFLEITVLDNGPGMTPEDLARVRARLESPHPPHGKRDRGIGMYNIQKRLALYMPHDSHMEVYSKQGLGTKMKLHIGLLRQEEGGNII